MTGFVRKHIALKRVIAVFLAATFFLTYVLNDASAIVRESVRSSLSPASEEYAHLDPDTFSIPEHLGMIKHVYNASSRKIVIHIQDAHCNYFAQNKISELIDYLNSEYGISMINLEGGMGDYDLKTFETMSDTKVRKEVTDYFVKMGELSGAEKFAISNPDRVKLWGIENKDLYFKNLKVYQDSLRDKEKIDKYLKELTYILNNLKRHIFTQDLLELDMQYNAYKADNNGLRHYLEYLLSEASKRDIEISRFPNLGKLVESVSIEEKINFSRANTERNILIDRLKEELSLEEIQELVARSIEFKTRKISRKKFYSYLFGKAKEVDLSLKQFPQLKSYMEYISLYETVDRMKVMDEFDDLENTIKEALYENNAQRELNTLSRNLTLLKNIFNVAITKDDYAYYRDNEESFLVANYLDFIEQYAPRYKISARPSLGIEELDDYREEIFKFYEYSFQRDEAFVSNMKFSDLPGEVESALIITGGFHTENLCELLKEKGISCISILPRFKINEEYESPYFALLAGKRKPVEQNIGEVVGFWLAFRSMLSGLAGEKEKIVFDLHAKWREALLEGKNGLVLQYGEEVLGAIDSKGEITSEEIDNFEIVNVEEIAPELMLPEAWEVLKAESITIDASDPDFVLPKGSFFRFVNADNLTEAERKKVLLQTEGSDDEDIIRWEELSLKFSRLNDIIKSFSDQASLRIIRESLPFTPSEEQITFAWIAFALRELLKNAFVHGNRQDLSLDVSVEWWIEDGSLVLQVSDHAVDKEISDVEASIAKTALVHGYGLGRLEMKKIGITLTESIKEGVGIHTAIFPLEDVDLLLATTDWLKRLTPWAPAWLRSLVIAPIVEEPIYRGLPILISLLIAPLVMSSFPVMGVLAITMTALVGQAISAVIFIRQHDKGKDIVQMAPFLVSMLTFAQFMGNASSPLTFLGLAIVTHFIVNLHSMLFPKIEIKPSERVGVEEEIEEDIQVIDGVVLDTKPVTIKKVEGLDKLRTDLPKEEPVKQRRPGVIGAELREGLSSPVRFFRTIFIFALIFLFVPLGLSQMACMSIDQQTQEDVFPEFESEIFRIESRVIVPTPINEFVQNSGESFYLRNYEKTIGTEFGVNANLPEVETLFGRGGDTKRAFLAIGSKDTSGIMYDSSGMPIGWEDFPLAVSDLVMLVRKAKENNVKLNLVLHDYSLADLDAHPDVITDPEKRQALIDLDRELLEAALLELGADSEWIASVEIMNEANLAIENTFTEDVQSFIQEGIVMVRETSIGTPISISTYTLEGLLYFRDNLQPGDSVQIHAYPDTVSNVPGDTFVEKFMYIGQYLNIPDGVDIYIGEIPAHDDLGAWQMEEVLRAAHQAGFKGVWFWFDNRPNPYYTFSDAEYQNAIGALQALPAVPEAPEIPFELEELFPEEPLTPHAGFGVRMTGKSYDSEMNIFLRKEDLRLDIENDRILKNFNKLSIEINGVTSTIYVHRLVLERIEEQRMTIQSFIDECIKIRGPDFEERLRAGLQGKPLIIDALEKSPVLYGNCIQDGYIYINEKALKKDVPFDLSIVGVSHELMHEAGIFDELDMAEGKLAEQDIKAMLDIGLNPLEVFEKIPNINLTKYIFFAYQGLLADAIGQDRVSGMGLGSAEFREELSKAIEARLEEKPVTPRELLESMTRTLIRGDQKVIIKEPVAQEILKSPFAEEILREIPAGCTPLGFGSTAIALKTPDGKALRIGPVKSRPNIPEVLQAGKRKIIGDLWQIEELALVSQEGLTVKDLNDLETKIKKRGYEFVDEGLDNIGRLPAGEIVVIDPGAVARMVTPSTMPVMEGSFKIGGETYRINTTDNRQRMAETLDKWFSRDKERVWNRNNWDYSGKRLTGDEYPTYLTSIESDSGEVLGMLTFHFRKKGEYFGGGRLPDDEYIVIDYIEVAPETREQGLGKILLARAFEEAKYYLADRDGPFDLAEYGSYNVALVHPAEDSEDVEKGKRAIDFFQRMGFSVVYQDSISGLDAEEAELQRFMGITGNRARVLLNEVRDQLGLPTDVELEPGEYDEYAEDIREYYEEVELAPLEEPSVLDQELAGTLTRVTTEFNRNAQLDAFMEKYINEKDIAGEALIVDMGVGYPPVTTVEAARRFFGKAQIVGVDINIPAYAVEFLKDAESNYIAFFDSNNEITYIAEVNRAKEGFYHSPLKKDEEAEVRKEALSIRDNFTRKGKGKDYSEAGASITFDPVQKYGSGEENLSFIRGDFIKGDFDLPRDADVIRAANVVLYYSAEEVRMAISKTGAKLKEGGILILGDNDSFVLYEKRKIEGTLVMVPVTLAGHTNVGLLSDAVGKTYLHASRYLTKIGIFSKGKQKAFPQYKRELDALEEAFTTAIRGYEDWAQLRDRADEHYVTIDAFIIQEMHKILVRHGVDSYIDRAGYLNVALSDKGMIPVVSRKELPPVGGGMNWDDVIKFTRERGVDWAIGYLKLTGLYSQADAVREALKDDPENLAKFEVAFAELFRGRKITSEEQLRGPVSIGEDTVQVERLFQVMRALDRGAEPATRMEDGIVFYDAYDIKRALSDEPIKVLAQSLAELHRENLMSVVDRGDPGMREVLVNRYVSAIKSGKAAIAVKDGNIIGFIAHAIGLGDLAIIDTFAVDRDFRGRGIGTNLMDIAVQNIIEEVRPTEIFIATPGELAEWYEEYLKKSNLRYDRDEEDSITVYLGGEEKMRAFQRLENIPELKGLISYKLEDIDEKYPEVESGAQGIIYVDPDDSRISYKLARDSSINEDDIQEARNIVELNSLGVTSGIPKLLAIGLDPDGFFWMKLEGIENAQDLFEYTRQGKWGVLPFTKKVEIFIKIAKIINELHKVGRIHFDIKPENILINDRGKVMVIDFRTVGKEGDKAVMGTPEYQPPEKVMRFKSDIFSLGRVMHDQLNILRDEELDISAENIQRSGLIDLVGWMTLMDASTRAPEDMETVVKSLETALVYLKAVEGREFVAEAVPLKIESIYPASREAEEVMRALNAPYNINFIRHEGRILTPENEAALYLAEKRVRDGFSDKVLSMELNIVPEYALGTSTYHFNDGEKTPMERDTGHILYYTKDKGTYKRPSAREVIAYIALSPEAGYTIYETFVNLVERLKISGADFSAKAASPRSTVLNKDNIVVTIPEYDLSRAIPVLREFVAENSLMIDEKAVPVGARDPDAKGLSWLREDKALSLKEAYLLLGHFIPADSNSMGDLKYSYDLAEEVGKYPIETVLVSGMGQRYLGLLLALMGKKVIFVDMDPMSISIFEGNREVLAEQLEKEGYDIELDIQAIQSEIGALDLEANGIEAGSFDLVTFIDLAGGTTIFGDPEVWLETASLLLKDEGYVVWHEGIIGKEYEWVQKIFQETFPDNEVVAEGKYFHGIHDADRGANIFYKVVNTPRIETRERAERIKKAVESSRKILALSRLNNPSAILIGLTENQMLGELTHGQRFANESRRVIEKKYNGNLRALYYERGDAESLEAAKDKAISWRDSLSEEAQARFQMLAYVDNNNMDREVANNADFIIAVNELSKMNQVAGVIREEIVEGQKLDEVLHIILALGLMDYERTQRIEMKNRILDLLSVMVDNPGELENVDINELLKGITFVRIKSLFAEMAERFEAQEEVLRSL